MRDRPPQTFGETAPLEVPAHVRLRPGAPAGEPAPATAASRGVSRVPGATSLAVEKPYDPLRLCIYTTIALISWLITPPLTMAIFGTIGVLGYVRARRRGLVASRCFLGDTRLVIAYLAILAVVGAGLTVMKLVS